MKVYDQSSGNDCANSAATRPYKRQSQGAWALIEEEKELLGDITSSHSGAALLAQAPSPRSISAG
jgi:hypothetical protein